MDLNDLEQGRSFQKNCVHCNRWCVVRTVAIGEEAGRYEYYCPNGHHLGHSDNIVDVRWAD
jgi:hypothetical protein